MFQNSAVDVPWKIMETKKGDIISFNEFEVKKYFNHIESQCY